MWRPLAAVTMQDMPNWSSNTITLSGPKPVIDRLEHQLLSDAGGDPQAISLLGSLYPMPEDLAGTTSPAREPHSQERIDEAAESDRLVMLDENAVWAARRELLVAAHGFDNWYDWCTARWGTKWPDRTYRIERRPRSIVLHGETAWSPPLEGLAYISLQLPDVRIGVKYFECGMGFAGTAAFLGGVTLHHSQRTYHGNRGG
jgi:hypothetical protein